MHKFWEYSFTIIFSVASVNSQNITIFTDSNGNGASKHVEISKCVSSLEPPFDKAISSLNTQGGCVHLYVEQGCQGSFILLAPGTPAHNDIAHYTGFHDRIRSIGPCHPKCHPDYQQGPTDKITVELFHHNEYQGGLSAVTLVHGSCVSFPQKMRKRVTSIRLSESRCVELYSDWNCTGNSKRLPAGSPYLRHLGFWEFNDLANSISFCGLNCGQRKENAVVLNEAQTSPGTSYVTIYSEPDFNGPLKHIDLGKNDEHCTNLTDEWQGAAMSIKRYNNCINIYELPDCSRSGKNYELKLKTFVSDLKALEFEQRIRSIDRCHYRKNLDDPRSINNYTNPISEGTPTHNNNTLIIIIFVGGLVLFVALAVAGSIYGIRLKQRQRRIEYILTEKEIHEFVNGFEGPLIPLEDGGSAVEYAYSMPYDKQYEIPRELISMDTKKPLGCGQYAVVYLGTVQHPTTGDKIRVAVKTIRRNAGDEYLRSLLKEIKTMSYVGHHSHTVKLMGCYTQDLQNELLVLTELCENGSMDKFLQQSRQSFANFVIKGQISDLECKKTLEYANTNLDAPNEFYFNTFHLIDWSYQIADGMAFLASKKVIHGDLAARNILLDSNYHVKIGDFGLSKQLYEYTQYVKKHQAPLPWRWSSIEILTELEFSTESDIWAFGVTLWEIFSLGATPYPGSVWGLDFLNSLKDGLRPSKPNFATSECYNLMLDCWREEPRDRITFYELKERFAAMIESLSSIRSQSSTFKDNCKA